MKIIHLKTFELLYFYFQIYFVLGKKLLRGDKYSTLVTAQDTLLHCTWIFQWFVTIHNLRSAWRDHEHCIRQKTQGISSTVETIISHDKHYIRVKIFLKHASDWRAFSSLIFKKWKIPHWHSFLNEWYYSYKTISVTKEDNTYIIHVIQHWMCENKI